MQPKWSVAKPPVSVQVGFYNIEWTESQLSGQNHEMHVKQLGRDCAGAFEDHERLRWGLQNIHSKKKTAVVLVLMQCGCFDVANVFCNDLCSNGIVVEFGLKQFELTFDWWPT